MKYIVLQKDKPSKWSEKEKEIQKVSIDNKLHVSEIRLPTSGKYYLIVTVDEEFETELNEDENENELLIKKPKK